MKYGMTRWLAMAVAAAGLSVSGCSRSNESTSATPLDNFTNPGEDTTGSPISIKDETTNTTEIALITAPAYQTNPLVTPEQIIPTRATTTNVAFAGILKGRVTEASAADRMLVFVDRIPWSDTDLGSNGGDSSVTCINSDWLVIDTGTMNAAAVDPDATDDGVSACVTTATPGCVAAGAGFGTFSGFMHQTAGEGYPVNPAGTNASGNGANLPATSVGFTGGVAAADICERTVPVRVIPSGSTNRAFSTLSQFPVPLSSSDFWVTFRFEFYRGATRLARTYSACTGVGGCTNPAQTIFVPENPLGTKRVGDFPFSFDSLPPRIDVTAFNRQNATVDFAIGGGTLSTAAANVASSITVNGTQFNVVQEPGPVGVGTEQTDFVYIDTNNDNVIDAGDLPANIQAFADLINRHPATSGVVRAYASSATQLSVVAIDRGAQGLTLAAADPVTPGLDYTVNNTTATVMDDGQDGPTAVSSLVTGGTPRQVPYGPIGYIQQFSDLSTVAGGSGAASGGQNFTALNAQNGDIVTFLSAGNNGRTRKIADVAVDMSIQATAGSTTSVTAATTGLSASPDYYVGGTLTVTTPTAAAFGQTSTIVDYDGAGVFNVSPAFTAAVAPNEVLRLDLGGAGTSPNAAYLASPALADSSAASFLLVHADIQALRPSEAGDAVVYSATRTASSNSALVTAVVQDGRPAYIYFESDVGATGLNGDELFFVTTQTGTAANRVRVSLEDTGGALGLAVEVPGVTPPAAGNYYVGSPDNLATATDDEGDAIIGITYNSGTDTLGDIINLVNSDIVARQFVTAVLGPAAAAGHAMQNGLGHIIPNYPDADFANAVAAPAEGGIIPGIGTDVSNVTIRGINQSSGAVTSRSTVISRSTGAADTTVATAVTQDIDAGGAPIADTAIRFYAKNSGSAGNGITVSLADAVSLDITDGVGTVSIEVPAGTTAEELVDFINEGTAGTRATLGADAAAGGRNDITFTNVTAGSPAATNFDIIVNVVPGAGSPTVTVGQVGGGSGTIVTITINPGLPAVSASQIVSLVNADPEAKLFVRASLTDGPTTADTVQVAPAPTTATFAGSAALVATANWYVGGTVTFTSGPNAGITRSITTYTAGRLITVSPAFPNAVTATDAFNVYNANDGQLAWGQPDDAPAGPLGGVALDGTGRSERVAAMHDGASNGAGQYDLTAGAPADVITYGGATPDPDINALLNVTGKLVSSNVAMTVGQFQGGQCLPSFINQTFASAGSLCVTVNIPVAEGETRFDVQASDGSGNITGDGLTTSLLNLATLTSLGSCSGGAFGSADRCEILDQAGAALGVTRDVTPPVLVSQPETAYGPAVIPAPATYTSGYEALAALSCSTPPAGHFCSQPVFVVPADAPSGGGSYTSFSPTVTVGGQVLDYASSSSAFDTAAAGLTLIRIQTDNGYDSFEVVSGTDDNNSPVPYAEGDAVQPTENGFYQYSNIDLRTGALTNFTVTAWDQAGNSTQLNFSVRQFEGNVNTPPHFAIDCIVEDVPATLAGSTVDANVPPRAILCENDQFSLNPNTPIVVRTLDTDNAAAGFVGGRFGDTNGEDGPRVTTAIPATGGTLSTITTAVAAFVGTDPFFHVGDRITITAGPGAGQTRTVSAFNGTTTFTVTPNWGVAPTAASVFTLASFAFYDSTSTAVSLAETVGGSGTVVDVAVGDLSVVADFYVGGSLGVLTTTGTLVPGEVRTIVDYDGAGTFTVAPAFTGASAIGDEFVLRYGDGRNFLNTGTLATLGAGVMPELDFRTVRSDNIYLQGRALALDASVPTVYLGSDPTIVQPSSDIMPADSNLSASGSDFLTLVLSGGFGGSIITVNSALAQADNLRLGDFIALSSLEPDKSPNVGLYRVEACEAEVNGYCVGAAPFDITLDKPLPADAAGMFLQAAYIWRAPNVPVPVEGINSYLFVAVDSVLSEPSDPLSGNQSVTPFAVIRDTQPPSIVINGLVNNTESAGYNPMVFMTDQNLFLGTSVTVPQNTASVIRVTRLDSNGKDETANGAIQRAAFSIYADALVTNSENTALPAQSLLVTQTSLGQARAALLTGNEPAIPLSIDNSCNPANVGDPSGTPCQPGYDITYRVEASASDRVGLNSVGAVQFTLVETATDRVLSGALAVISSNPAVISLLSDPTELSTLTMDQLANSGVLYNLNYHVSLLLGSPTDTASSNPRQAFYQDSRTDFAVVLGTLLRDTDGTGNSESTVVILGNVGRILLDNGVLDDLLPLLDDQAIINPRARDSFGAGPRPFPGDATLSSLFLEEIMRDVEEAAQPCNVGTNAYDCYQEPGTVKNTLPMVKAALESQDSLRMRASDVTALGSNLNARISGTDLVIDATIDTCGLVPCAQLDSTLGGFLPNNAGGAEDSEINVQVDDWVEVVSGTCAGSRARVVEINDDDTIHTLLFAGARTTTSTAAGVTGGGVTIVDSAPVGGIDPATYVGQTLSFPTDGSGGLNAGRSAIISAYAAGTFTLGACSPTACVDDGATLTFVAGQALASACTTAGGCQGTGCAFRVVQPNGPSLEPVLDLADHLLFQDLDGDGNFGEREVLQSLASTLEEGMANPQVDLLGTYLGSYPTEADRVSLICNSAFAGFVTPAYACPADLDDIQDAPSMQAVLDLLVELSDDYVGDTRNVTNGIEFLPRVVNLVSAILSEYPREATNPLAPEGATVLESVSFILNDLLTDQTQTGLLDAPETTLSADFEDMDTGNPADDRQHNRLNLLMRSTYIMGPRGVGLSSQTVALSNPSTGSGNVAVSNVLEAIFPLLWSVTNDPDDNARGCGSAGCATTLPPFNPSSTQESVLEKLLPAIDLVIRDNRLEDVISDLADILDPGTSVSDLTAFRYTGTIPNTGFADQNPNPYTVNPPLLKVIAELGGAKVDAQLDGITANDLSTIDIANDTFNVLLTRVGQNAGSENISNDGSSVNTNACSEAYFSGRTPMEILLNVVAQMAETAPKDPRSSNFRDLTCGAANPGNTNRTYLRVLVDGLFDDPNSEDITADDAAANTADDVDDFPGNPNAGGLYTCGGNRGPQGGDGIAVAQSTLDILPEVLNTVTRFGFDSQDRINSIFAGCAGACPVNNGYPPNGSARYLSGARLGIDLGLVLDAPFQVGSGSGLIRFEQSLVREVLEQLALMTATDAANYLILLTVKIADDITPINGTLSVPDPQDIARSTAGIRALADPDGDGNPAPDGLLDDVIPVAQALSSSGLAAQVIDLLRSVRACGVDDAPGANGRDIKGGSLLKSSEDLTLMLLDAYSGALSSDGDNDGTGRDLVGLVTPSNNAVCPADGAAADGAARGYKGGPLDHNPAREQLEVSGGASTTTVQADATDPDSATLTLSNGFYSSSGAYVGTGRGLITFKNGLARGLTRQITNYTVLGNIGTFTFDAVPLPNTPAAGDDFEVSLSTVDVGVLTSGKDIAITSQGASLALVESRNWNAQTAALPPSTTNFRTAGVGAGAFLCIQTRGASEAGGYDEACSPITVRPGSDTTLTDVCTGAGVGDNANCLTVDFSGAGQIAQFGEDYDNVTDYMQANCNQIAYTADAASVTGTSIVVTDSGLNSTVLAYPTTFNNEQFIFQTGGGGIAAGSTVTITSATPNLPGAGQVTFAVSGLDLTDDPDGLVVRFYQQQCSYRVRMMREPYNGCFQGADIAGGGLGLALSSFGGPTPLRVNAFRDSRMDLLLRAANSLADGANAVDTDTDSFLDYAFFDRVLSLVTVAVQPNTDPNALNNRSIASNLIFGPDGTSGTGTGPVQRMLNDASVRSALTAAGSLFAELTAATGAPAADSAGFTADGPGADTFRQIDVPATFVTAFPFRSDVVGRNIQFTAGANNAISRIVTDYNTGTRIITVGSPFPNAVAADAFILVGGGENVYDRYPDFVAASGWAAPAGVTCTNAAARCDGNAVNDAVDFQLVALSGLLETLGDRDGRDNVPGANAVNGSSRQEFSDDPRMLFNLVSRFIQSDVIRQLIPGLQIITEQTDLVPAAAYDWKTSGVATNNGAGMIIDGDVLTNIISRTARSANGDNVGRNYDGRIYDGASFPAQQRPVLDTIGISPTYGLVKTVLALFEDWEQNADYDPAPGIDANPFATNAEYENNLRYRSKLVAMEDLLSNLIGSQRDGLEQPTNTDNHVGRALRLLLDIAKDTDTTALHDRTIDNVLSVQTGLAQRDIIDTPTLPNTDYYRSGLDVVMDFVNTLIEDPTDCDESAPNGLQRGAAGPFSSPVAYNACIAGGANNAANAQAVFRDRGALFERPIQPILDEDLFTSLATLLAGDAESKIIGALPFISAIVGSQTYALDDDPVSGTGPLVEGSYQDAAGCGLGAADRSFCGVEYTEGVTIADALFADIQSLIPGSATVGPRIKREDDENRYDPLITDDYNRNGELDPASVVLQGPYDGPLTGSGYFSAWDQDALSDPQCTADPNCADTENDNIVIDCSPPEGSAAGTVLVECTDTDGIPETVGFDRRIRIGFTAVDGVITTGNINGINAALFDGLADLIARENAQFAVNNQIPRSSTQGQSMDQLTVRELDVSSGLPVDPGFVDLVTALGEILIQSNVGN